jgi:hypothetical protein
MNHARKTISSVESKGSEQQEKHNAEVKSFFEGHGFKVMTFDEAIEQQASKPVITKPEWIKEETRPSYCDCDYLVNGKSGRICQTHLFSKITKGESNE